VSPREIGLYAANGRKLTHVNRLTTAGYLAAGARFVGLGWLVVLVGSRFRMLQPKAEYLLEYLLPGCAQWLPWFSHNGFGRLACNNRHYRNTNQIANLEG